MFIVRVGEKENRSFRSAMSLRPIALLTELDSSYSS